LSSRFRINNPPVVAETLGGEATIVDLDSGTYYALNESGSYIWDELSRGEAVDRIAGGLERRYELDSEEATREVETLVAELSERKLIAPLGNGEIPATAGGNGAGPDPGPYSPPQLSVYTDMQELLLLDPVHEVDDSGWPARP
jgi:hypothetical protein